MTEPALTVASRPPSLLREPDFLKLWTGLTISLFGANVTGLALPLTAVVVLGASASEMGAMGALRWLPYLLFGLLAGAWLDRVRRRPVLIATHLGRALLLGTIPLAHVLGALRIEHLYVVAFATGALMIFSDAAYQAITPTLVPRERLVEGNSRLELSRSVSQIAGPGLAGVIIQVITAPLAIALDAVAFVVDAILVGLIRTPEPAPTAAAGNRSLRREIGEGVRWVFGSPLLRPIQLTSMTFIGSNAIWTTVYVLYLTREARLEPFAIGLIFAALGPGSLVGSLVAGRIIGRIGLGPTIVWAQVFTGGATICVPLVAPTPLVVPLLMTIGLASGFGITIGSVAEISLRQGITPQRLQGRMNATMRSLNWSTVAVGSLIGGALGETVGLWPTLAIGAILSASSVVWVALSPVLRFHRLPVTAPEAAGEPT